MSISVVIFSCLKINLFFQCCLCSMLSQREARTSHILDSGPVIRKHCGFLRWRVRDGLGRGLPHHTQKYPQEQSSQHGSLPTLPCLKNPPGWALPFQLEFLKLQMNFFVGCGEVKLCLLLYIIVLIMLNNFFQTASLWFTEALSWWKSWDLEKCFTNKNWIHARMSHTRL